MLDFMDEHLREIADGTNAIKPQSWLGYTGYAVRGLFVGARHDGAIVRASGYDAKVIEKTIRENNWDARCTRLDLQVTANVGQAETDYGRRVREAIEASAGGESSAKGFNIAFYKARGCDSGVTVGARSSERYARFYNKTAEQRGRVEPGLWRFEVEFKGQQARMMYQMLMSSVNGSFLALSIVKTTFEMHGVDMDWIAETEPQELPSSYQQTDDERRLRWLERNVSRTVADLKARGLEKEVRRALDLR